jgi:hypothetical protein
MQSDKLRRAAMATSGCDCLQLSTPEGDPTYRYIMPTTLRSCVLYATIVAADCNQQKHMCLVLCMQGGGRLVHSKQRQAAVLCF